MKADSLSAAAMVEAGYTDPRQLPDGKWIGIMRQAYTTGLFIGLTEFSYERRYCYESRADAYFALLTWDGAGDPPGPWIKEKPSERLGPGATQ